MGFSRQEHWSVFPFLPPGDLLDPEMELGSPALQADSLLSEPPGKPVPLKEALFMTMIEAYKAIQAYKC